MRFAVFCLLASALLPSLAQAQGPVFAVTPEESTIKFYVKASVALVALLIRALLSYYLYYGDNVKIECPTGSGISMNLFDVAREIANRLTRIFLRDESGRRPVYGGTEKFQTDPHWKDYVLFYEYFHGDNGAGLGASHQTGWTGLIAKLIDIFGRLDGSQILEAGKKGAFTKKEPTADKKVA
jgi:hypothetical protein